MSVANEKHLQIRLARYELDVSWGAWALLRGSLFLTLGLAVLWAPTARLGRALRNFQVFGNDVSPGLLAPAAVDARTEAWPGPEWLTDRLAGRDAAPAKRLRPVVFRLLAPAARQVYLGGTFNGFDARKCPMTQRADGLWEITMELGPGRYVYKFKVDGRWELDPTNPESTPAPRAGSVLEIQ